MHFKPAKILLPRSRRNHQSPSKLRFAGGHSSGRSESKTLRVVTFNVKFARHIDRAVELFKGSDALRGIDILALQEMDENGADQIARRLGLNYVYYPAHIHKAHGKNFGNALLSPLGDRGRSKDPSAPSGQGETSTAYCRGGHLGSGKAAASGLQPPSGDRI